MALAGAGFAAVARAVLLTADSVVAAASGVPAAPAAGPTPVAPRAILFVVAALPFLLLRPAAVVAAPLAAVAASPARALPLPSSSSPRRSGADGPRRPLRDWGSLDLLACGAGVLRKPVVARPVTYSDRIPLGPITGRLGGSLLLLGVRRLDLLRRRRGGLPHQWTRRGALDTRRRPRNGGACKRSKAKSQSP